MTGETELTLTIGTFELLLTSIAAGLFCATYLIFTKRVFRTPISRAIFIHVLSGGLTLLTVFLASDAAFGPAFWGRPWFRIVFFGAFGLSLYNLWRVLIWSQLSARYRERYNLKYPMSDDVKKDTDPPIA